MEIKNTFDLMCLTFDLQGAEKVQAFHAYQAGGENAVIKYLIDIRHPTLIDDDAEHTKLIGEERQTVYKLLGKESAAKSAQTIKRRLFLGKRTKEGD